MIGEYIIDRYLPRIVSEICSKQGIAAKTFSDDWIVRMQKDGRVEWAVGYNFSLNNAGGVRIAEDKVATYLVLKDAGIPAIEHYLARPFPGQIITLDHFPTLPRDACYILKPLVGTGGRGITKHGSLESAVATINEMPTAAFALSPHYEIISERRYIVLDNEIVLAIEKTNPRTIDGVVFYNLGKGAIPATIEPDEYEMGLACDASRACSLRISAVDVVTLADGSRCVLEVNSGLMLENYMRHRPENLERGREVYEKIIDRLFA